MVPAICVSIRCFASNFSFPTHSFSSGHTLSTVQWQHLIFPLLIRFLLSLFLLKWTLVCCFQKESNAFRVPLTPRLGERKSTIFLLCVSKDSFCTEYLSSSYSTFYSSSSLPSSSFYAHISQEGTPKALRKRFTRG